MKYEIKFIKLKITIAYPELENGKHTSPETAPGRETNSTTVTDWDFIKRREKTYKKLSSAPLYF